MNRNGCLVPAMVGVSGITEMVALEWLRTAEHPAFRKALELVKQGAAAS
jgi:hypothetical protein